MKRLTLVATLLSFALPALAAEPASAAGASDPMKEWNPPKVKKEKVDRAEISALLKKLDDAAKKGDLDAVMGIIDFPVLMTTDDSKGQAMSDAWTADRYRKEMEPFYKPMPNVKVKHKPNVFLITDSLANVTDVQTVTMGNKTIIARSALLLVRTGGDWKIKAMTEGGWGDMMGGSHSAGAGTTPSSTEPSTGSSGGTEPSGTSGATEPSGTTGEAQPHGTGSTSGTGGASEPAPTTPPPSR